MKRLLAAGLVLLLFVAGGLALLESRNKKSVTADADSYAATYELAFMHRQVSVSVLDELNQLVLATLGNGSDSSLEAATERRSAVAMGAADRIESLRSAGLLTEAQAESAQAFVSTASDLDPAVDDPFAFYDVWYAGFDEIYKIAAADSQLVSAAEFLDASITSRLVLFMGLHPDIAQSQVTPPAHMAEFWDYATEIASDDVSQLAHDDASPLPWFEDAMEFYQTPMDAITSGLSGSGLLEYDIWLAGWAPGAAPAPMDTEQLRQVASEQMSQTDALVERVRADDLLGFSKGTANDRNQASLLRMGGWTALALALAGALWLSITGFRGSRQLASAAVTDPLTGAGNRRLLETTVTKLLDHPDYPYHFVGMVDLDRFKMVNDSWGHAAGDAVLVAVTARMQNALTQWEKAAGRVGNLVRLGGDEFAIVVHATEPFSAEQLEVNVRRAVELPVRVPEGDIAVHVSMGFAPCANSAQFPSSLAAADLAAYENKDNRRRTRAEDSAGLLG